MQKKRTKTKAKTITITLNGDVIKCDGSGMSVTALLEREGLAKKKVAVAINGQFIPRSAYDEHTVKDEDEIDIVAPMQGG
ncbi:MAG: sulfur carrier protein ThiS [Alphaproteobacteria bacterium]|nr:sulfur carrier protein ThiS [Alphaproteobacteria bacterium]